LDEEGIAKRNTSGGLDCNQFWKRHFITEAKSLTFQLEEKEKNKAGSGC
jgi:hypothetical protein